MPTEFHLSFLGEDQLKRRLEGIDAALTDASPAFEEMADAFLVAEARQYASEGGYGSGGWAALSPKYARWKAKHYPGAPIGVLSGDTRAGLTDGPEIRIITPLSMTVGVNTKQAWYQQHGTPRMPARPPIALPESERRAWVKILQRYVLAGGARDTPMALL